MPAVLHRTSDTTLVFNCPACDAVHEIRATEHGQLDPALEHWQWNRSLVAPTFYPSLIHETADRVICHSWIRDGQMHFLSDCTAHSMSGRAVAIPTWEGRS